MKNFWVHKIYVPLKFVHILFKCLHTYYLTIVTYCLTGYLALNLKDMLHVAHSIFMFPYMVGYSINYAFGLVLTSQGILLLVAGSYLLTTPPYLLAEWLSNNRSFTQCLALPESHHNDDRWYVLMVRYHIMHVCKYLTESAKISHISANYT